MTSMRRSSSYDPEKPSLPEEKLDVTGLVGVVPSSWYTPDGEGRLIVQVEDPI